MSQWSDQYKYPNWQKKRLEALEQAEFRCQRCFDGESQLQVHHKVYIKGRSIWDYANNELAVLCDSCHLFAHEEKTALNGILMQLHPDGMQEIIGLIIGYCNHVYGPARLDLDATAFDDVANQSTMQQGAVAAATQNLNPKERFRLYALLMEKAKRWEKDRELVFSIIKKRKKV